MFSPKTVLALAALFAGVSSRYVYKEDIFQPRYFSEEANVAKDNYEDAMSEQYYESVHPNYLRLARSSEEANAFVPGYYLDLEDVESDLPLYEAQSHKRMVRQAQGEMKLRDKTIDLSGAIPLAGNDKNALSAVGTIQGLQPNTGSYNFAGAGLQLSNVDGHSLTGMASHVPNLGNQLLAAGKVNLLDTNNHHLDANAFASRTFTSNPQLPNFNTYGGTLDYMYKDRVGATLGATKFPSFGRTDYSAMGKLNLMKTPTSSFDFNAGVTRMNTPFFSRTEPKFDFTFTKSW